MIDVFYSDFITQDIIVNIELQEYKLGDGITGSRFARRYYERFNDNDNFDLDNFNAISFKTFKDVNVYCLVFNYY